MAVKPPPLTQSYVKSLFDYDPECGALSWKYNDTLAGYRDGRHCGLKVNLLDHTYWVHHVIWVWMEGSWPTRRVMHVNRNPRDNRWDNLYVPYHVKESDHA